MSIPAYKFSSPAGQMLYVIQYSYDQLQAWRNDTHAYEPWNVAHIANYKAAMSDPTGRGQYVANVDTALPASTTPLPFEIVDGSNNKLGDGLLDWNGSSEVSIDSVGANVLSALKLLQADWVVDTNTTPWDIVALEAGTGGLGVGVELLRKKVSDVAGGNVTSTATVVGRLTT